MEREKQVSPLAVAFAPDFGRNHRSFPGDEPRLSRLGSNQAFILIGAGDDLDSMRESAIEGVCKGDGKCRGEKVDIELQIALGIEAVNPQRSSAAAG
jgi:hypothetical protein